MSVRASSTRPSTGLTRRPSLTAHKRNAGVCATTGTARAASKQKYCGLITLQRGMIAYVARNRSVQRGKSGKKKARAEARALKKTDAFRLPTEPETHAELPFVDAFAREVGDSQDAHEVTLVGDSTGSRIRSVRVAQAVVRNVEMRVVREVECLEPEL